MSNNEDECPSCGMIAICFVFVPLGLVFLISFAEPSISKWNGPCEGVLEDVETQYRVNWVGGPNGCFGKLATTHGYDEFTPPADPREGPVSIYSYWCDGRHKFSVRFTENITDADLPECYRGSVNPSNFRLFMIIVISIGSFCGISGCVYGIRRKHRYTPPNAEQDIEMDLQSCVSTPPPSYSELVK